MMGRKAARNMWRHNRNKIGIQCVCWFYSQGIVTMHGHAILKKKEMLSFMLPTLFLYKNSCSEFCENPVKGSVSDIRSQIKVWA